MDLSKETAKQAEKQFKQASNPQKTTNKNQAQTAIRKLNGNSDGVYQPEHIPTPRIATTRKLAATIIPARPYAKTEQDTETPEHYNSK